MRVTMRDRGIVAPREPPEARTDPAELQSVASATGRGRALAGPGGS